VTLRVTGSHGKHFCALETSHSLSPCSLRAVGSRADELVRSLV
jgi:hypothetical protein